MRLVFYEAMLWSWAFSGVKTGESAFEAIYRMSFKDCYQQHLEDAKKFRSPMKRALTLSDCSILDSYDFAGSNKLVVLASGGHRDGELIATILQNNLEVTKIHSDPVDIVRRRSAPLALRYKFLRDYLFNEGTSLRVQHFATRS